MSTVGGLLWLVGGLGGLCAAAGLVACCLRARSALAFFLATYVLAWSALVGTTLVLSSVHLVTRGWLVAAIAVELVVALAAWVACGRPRPPGLRPVLEGARHALGHPAVLILAVAVALGFAYGLALALLTPVNDWDALTYHLARAAFWKQEQGLGYVAGATDLRLNVNPPNGEIGQLATMVLSQSDRYVALPQLVAYGASISCVAALARQLGLGVREAAFGALAFATLPVVVVQASGALNDLVTASFMASAVVFALLGPWWPLVLAALALGLAVGAKFTAVLALPAIALVVGAGRPLRDWPRLALAGVVGLGLGSTWYIVNLVETGDLDGGLGHAAEQRAELALEPVATTAVRLGLDVIDMSGAPEPYDLLFAVPAGLVILVALLSGGPRSRRVALAAASIPIAGVMLLPAVFELAERVVVKAWLVLGAQSGPEFERWDMNVEADATLSWYGPLGALLLPAGAVGVVVLWLRRSSPALGPALVLAPWVLLLTLALTIDWDPWRGRFLIGAVALAAATWGFWLRHTVVAAAITGIAVTSLVLGLANHHGKPSGVGELWPRELSYVSERSIWRDSRSEAQVRFRSGAGDNGVVRYFNERVPAAATVALAVKSDDFISPYFGPRLSRRVWLVRDRERVPVGADWLVLSPTMRASRCREAWEQVFSHRSGWRIERRTAADACGEEERAR